MPFELIEHKADVGIRGIGDSLSKAFEEAGKALFFVMAELGEVRTREEVKVVVHGDSRENLLVEWLNELLYLKDVREMLFSQFKVKEIRQKGEKWELIGAAFGEKIDLSRHRVKTEVKAASYSGLKVGEENGKFVAQCVVDV